MLIQFNSHLFNSLFPLIRESYLSTFSSGKLVSESTCLFSWEQIEPLLANYTSSKIESLTDEEFKDYLTGLYEGDGCAYLKKVSIPFLENHSVKTSESSPRYYSYFSITLQYFDIHLLLAIRKRLGFGNISVVLSQGLYLQVRLDVYKFSDILQMIHIFNGRILLQKRHIQFQKWVDNFNLTSNINPLVEVRPGLVGSELENYILNSYWLSGFIDAEGSFIVTSRTRSNRYKYSSNIFAITQKGEYEFLVLISRLLQSSPSACKGLTYLVFNKAKECDAIQLREEVSLSSKTLIPSRRSNKFSTLINYLSRFPLISRKSISSEFWVNVLHLKKTQIPLSEQAISDITIITSFLKEYHSTIADKNTVSPLKPIHSFY